MTAAGHKCCLVGQGAAETFGEDLAARLGTNLRTLHQSLAAVAEFKGETYGHGLDRGVVRFVQVDEETCVVEGRVSGLEPGLPQYAVDGAPPFGDVTRGVESVGGVWENGGELGVSGEADARADGVVASRVVDARLKVKRGHHHGAPPPIGRPRRRSADEAQRRRRRARPQLSAGMGDNLKQQCSVRRNGHLGELARRLRARRSS